MSTHCHFQEDTMHNLRHIQRQMKLLDLRLQLLRERLCASRLHRLALHCCSLHPHCIRPMVRRALTAKMDMERRLDRLKRHGMILKSPCCPSHLALVDMKGFDPSDVTVMVKDGRVTVAAEHEDECNTGLAKTHSHRKFIKEFSLPPAGNENEVTYSLESNSLTKIEPAPVYCPHLCNC